MGTKTKSKSLNYIVKADGDKVAVTADRKLADLLLAKHACAGQDVDLVSSNTGRGLSWYDLPCVCGRHEGATVVQRG